MIKSITGMLLALFMLLSTSGAREWKDTFNPEDFPQIGIEKQKENTTRIMSFNVRFGAVNGVSATKRTHLVVDQIKAVNPASVGVQEATPYWTFILQNALENYKGVGGGRNDGLSGPFSGEHSSIYYNSDSLKCLKSGTFWLSKTPSTPSRSWGSASTRICTWAVLQYRDTGVTYVHVNTHLDNESEEARMNGAKLILSFIEENFSGINVVLTGDFNSHEDQGAYLSISEKMADTKYSCSDSRYFDTFHDGTLGEALENLDYIFCSENVKAESFRVVTTGIDGRFSSDHFPLYADVTLDEGAKGFEGNVDNFGSIC